MVRASVENISEDDLYCTPEQVMQAIGMVDPYTGKILQPSDVDITQRQEIVSRIISKMNEIDTLTKDSWRCTQERDQIYDINTYWHDIAGERVEYYRQGGYFVQLCADVQPWDMEKGDRLYIRTANNQYVDISESVRSEKNPNGRNWIDYNRGKLYIQTWGFQVTAHAVKITYRHGKDVVPMDIQRCCALMVGMTLMDNQFYATKIGSGGDLSSLLSNNRKAMQDEVNMIIREHVRYGSFYSLYG